jgi:small-conductance mechanosensitive channel
LVFKGLKKVSFAAKITTKQKQMLQRNLPKIELIVWMLFITWMIDYFFNRNDFFAGALIIVALFALVWIAIFGAKEFIAGFIFKSSSGFYLNDCIELGKIKGKISMMNYQSLEIEDESGKIIQVPYSKILKNSRKKNSMENLAMSQSFILEVKTGKKIQNTIKEIEEKIINSPYSALNKWPKIEILTKTQNNSYQVRISLHTLNADYFHLIKEEISQIYGY